MDHLHFSFCLSYSWWWLFWLLLLTSACCHCSQIHYFTKNIQDIKLLVKRWKKKLHWDYIICVDSLSTASGKCVSSCYRQADFTIMKYLEIGLGLCVLSVILTFVVFTSAPFIDCVCLHFLLTSVSSTWHVLDLSRYLNEWRPECIWMLLAGFSHRMQTQLLCIWSCFCALIFRQKANKEVNYKNLVKVQFWNISCLYPFLFF